MRRSSPATASDRVRGRIEFVCAEAIVLRIMHHAADGLCSSSKDLPEDGAFIRCELSQSGTRWMMYYARMSILRFAGALGPQLGVVLGEEVAPLDISLDPRQGVEVVLDRAPDDVGSVLSDARRHGTRLPLEALKI